MIRQAFPNSPTILPDESARSPDGGTVASTDFSGVVTLWDTTAGTKWILIKGSDATVWGVAFSPDGGTLASTCGDNIVRLWDS